MNDTDTSRRVRARWASLLQSFRWSHFATLTTSELVSVDRLRRYHVHALLAHTESVKIAQLERAWKLGNASIVVYDPQRDAADYVSKYLACNPNHYDLSRRALPRGYVAKHAPAAAALRIAGPPAFAPAHRSGSVANSG